MILIDKQHKKALVFYFRHEKHLNILIKDVQHSYPPSLIEDKNDPSLWKPNHWKWFIGTQIKTES